MSEQPLSLMEQLTGVLMTNLGAYAPKLVTVLLVVVLGWFVALAVRAGIRALAGKLDLNRHLEAGGGRSLDIEGGIASGVYYAILLVVLVAAVNALDLSIATEPLRALLNPLFGYVPMLIGGGVLALTAWVIATVVRKVSQAALGATSLDERLAAAAGVTPVSENIATALYYLIILLFLPGILGALGLQGLMVPFEEMVGQLLGALPNVIAALVIGAVGWFLAYLLSELSTNVVKATPADKWVSDMGASGLEPSKLAGVAVRIVVFVPALIAALDALQMASVSEPATAMLSTLLAAVPMLIAAGLILAIAWFVARIVSPLMASLLEGLGLDNLPEKLGIGEAFGDVKLSEMGGKLTTLAVMLFAAVEASARLGFTAVADLVEILIRFGGQVLLGIVIIAVGLWLANAARSAIERMSGEGGTMMGQLARFAILALVTAMGLNAMGVADEIVNMAFGLTLGAAAVAAALAFGLGGREAAGKVTDELAERWLSKE